jgi:myo-inositol-1(or 4)-monophosphatase
MRTLRWSSQQDGAVDQGHPAGLLSTLTEVNIKMLTDRVRGRLSPEARARPEVGVYDETVRFNIVLVDGTCGIQPYLPEARRGSTRERSWSNARMVSQDCLRSSRRSSTRCGTEQATVTASPRSLMPLALDAVDQAVDVVHTTGPGALAAKGDRDMASEVDIRMEREMRQVLANRAPGIGFRSEERGRTGDGDPFWALDPVDGAANFVRGVPLCAVSLALVDHGQPRLAVTALPFLNARYAAERSNGAYEGTRRLRASQTTSLHDAIAAIGDYAVGNHAERKNRVRLAVTELLAERAQRVRMLGGAAADLVWVADGKVDASITLSNEPGTRQLEYSLPEDGGTRVVDRDGRFTASTRPVPSPPLRHRLARCSSCCTSPRSTGKLNSPKTPDNGRRRCRARMTGLSDREPGR